LEIVLVDQAAIATVVSSARTCAGVDIAPLNEEANPKTVSVEAAAHRLGISAPSVHKLIRDGVLPGTQLMKSAPWQIPIDALDSEAVRIDVQQIAERRPTKALAALDNRLLRLPGF
jgi:hypothetical protein